jgi:hypothetical protein
MTESFREDKRERAIEKEERKSAYAEIKNAVKEAIEEQAVSNGQLTFASFSSILDDRELRLLGSVSTQMDDVVTRIEASLSQFVTHNQRRIQSPRTPMAAIASDACRLYQHANGKMYITPEEYELPEKANLYSAFRMWINGDTFNADTVRPFILWSVTNVPHFLWKKFRVGWYDALHQIMDAPALHALEADLSDSIPVPEDELKRLFDEGIKYLISQYSYISNRGYQKWSVTTWSRQMLFSSIMKHGTEEEKVRATGKKNRWNRPHGTKRKRTMVQQTLC